MSVSIPGESCLPWAGREMGNIGADDARGKRLG
jgi:hypothetical protein